MATFLLELGFEELPSRFLPIVEQELGKRFAAVLAEASIAYTGMQVVSTPRRAALLIDGLPAVQPLREEEVLGPPARIAFDAEGKPAKAAEGFAKTAGVGVDALYRVNNEKGEYVALRKKTGGQATQDVLAAICPQIIAALPFPKRMRWGAGDFQFARPLRWIVALFDDAVIAFTVGTVQSGRETCGHRIHGFGPFAVPAASEYYRIIQEQGAISLESSTRKAHIVAQGTQLAAAVQGRVLWNDALLDEVVGLTEHPVPLVGDFDPVYLELPREVLLTSMQSHQKSFGVENAQGQLLPHFVTVLNISPPEEALVKKGWERVLRARLEDARFFWQSDIASSFDAWRAALDSVTFLAPLGSMGEKSRRIGELSALLAQTTGIAGVEDARRAGLLSKADLVSGMVGEFATLQGVMGGIYARKHGEAASVASAIAEQYLPAGPDSPIPTSDSGCLLSIADKADTLVGCFGLGMIPTGAQDPYALRRCALGIARIMLEKGLRFDVKVLFAKALEAYGQRSWKFTPAEILEKLEDFFATRVKNMLLGPDVDTLCVEAVVAAGACDVWAAAERLKALTIMSQRADFDLAVQTLKRVSNIVRKYPQAEALSGSWSTELLQDDAEKKLSLAVTQFIARFDALYGEDHYEALFALLGELRPDIDLFFEKVMVMCDDVALRHNRLNLLGAIVNNCSRLADFTALQR